MPVIEEVEKCVVENRKGRFDVSYDLIHSNDASVNKLFEQVKVIDAINDDLYEKTTYTAYSDLFEPLMGDDPTPEYLIIVDADESKKMTLHADRLFDDTPILDVYEDDYNDDIEEFVKDLNYDV